MKLTLLVKSIAALTGLLAVPTAVWAEVPTPYDTQKSSTRPLPAEEAAARWKFPEGFQVSVFAAEPEVRQPIAMAIDDRGRLWVAENYTYAEVRHGFAEDQRDRILIFEDSDGDGKFDTRTVFLEGLQRLTSIEIGFGGVWALTSPTLVFIADRNGDDRPDDPANPTEVKLDGFEWRRNHHTLANGLRWGPDGWLYGRHGIQAVSEIGVPGTPPGRRARTNGGIWRYHPQRQDVEIVCHGTTNPWGMDWNDRGEAFFINTVIGHLWQVIPGGHYRRMHGTDLIPNIYEVIEQHADHVHWASGQEDWNSWRKLGTTAASDAAGGGHAHTGLLFYSGDNWPALWQGRLITINFNGRRLNSDEVVRTPTGSGYVGRHQPDLGLSADPWFRGIDLIGGPDGGVFIADWSDTGECHDDDGVYRNSGRVYKVTHGRPARPALSDLSGRTPSDLIAALDQPNEFFARHARRRLQELFVAGADLDAARTALHAKYRQAGATVERLRALWSLRAVGGTDPAFLRAELAAADEHVRAWAIRFLVEDTAALAQDARSLAALTGRAEAEPSAFVRLSLASALQRVPLEKRAALARPLLQRTEDAMDHNLPGMLWYGIEPLAATQPNVLAQLEEVCQLPLTRRCLSRRLTQDRATPAFSDALSVVLAHAAREPAIQRDVLTGMRDALRGQRSQPPPRGWTNSAPNFASSRDPQVQSLYRGLGAIFVDPQAADALRDTAKNGAVPIDERRAALRLLVDLRATGLAGLCASLLTTPGLAATAVDGLSLEADPAIVDRVAQRWNDIGLAERGAILSTLLSRAPWVLRVLEAVAEGRVPRGDLTAFHARQIRGFKNPALDRRLTEVWGASRESGASTLARIEQWKGRLTPEIIRAADSVRGRAVFKATCATCHVLNGEGGRIGPELTGSARDNLDYLLPNIVDPSAALAREYQMVTLTLKDGRSLSGVLRSREAENVVLQTLGETVTVPAADVTDTEESAVSLMPDELLEALPEADVQALFAYLMKK